MKKQDIKFIIGSTIISMVLLNLMTKINIEMYINKLNSAAISIVAILVSMGLMHTFIGKNRYMKRGDIVKYGLIILTILFFVGLYIPQLFGSNVFVDTSVQSVVSLAGR